MQMDTPTLKQTSLFYQILYTVLIGSRSINLLWYTPYTCCCYHANANPWRDSFLLVLQYSARKYAAYISLIYFLFALYTTMYIPLLG